MTMLANDTLAFDDLPALLTRLTGDEKHDWSSLSTLDVLWVLYDRIFREDDRFLLSKGHGPAAFYAVLAAKGILPVRLLDGFGDFDSPLGNHPDRVLARKAGIGTGEADAGRPGDRTPATPGGVELSSGSLGHGLPIAVGVALTGRRVLCLVGDGELEEGSNWEAVRYAGRVGLAALTAIVVDNRSSTHGWPDGIERRFAGEGWTAVRVGGRDHDALEAALAPHSTETRPRCVVAEVTR
jgi:transketolase